MYFGKLILVSLLTVFLASTITFVLIRSMPGDQIAVKAMEIAQQEGITYEIAYQRAEAIYKVDKDTPITTQYFNYLGNLCKGSLGNSTQYRIPVVDIIVKAVPWTIFICLTSLIISFIIGKYLGLYAAWKRKSIINPIITGYASISNASPAYITALILIIIFAINLQIFPTRGNCDINTTPGFNLPFLLDVAYHAVLPITAYVIEGFGAWSLLIRSSATDILGEDYLVAAKIKGLKPARIKKYYLGKNAIIMPFTSFAISVAATLGASALVETVFAYPGIGFFLGQAISLRDYPLMQGIFLMMTIATIIATLASEVMLYFIDPRIRYRH